jgi:hypothetical protein
MTMHLAYYGPARHECNRTGVSRREAAVRAGARAAQRGEGVNGATRASTSATHYFA